MLRPRVARIGLWHARIRVSRRASAEADTLPPEEPSTPRSPKENPARAAKLRRSADALVRLASAPARRLPKLELYDVEVASGEGEDALMSAVRLGWLSLTPGPTGIRLATVGEMGNAGQMPFNASLSYGRDDRILGGARFLIPDSSRARVDTLLVTVEGTLRQNYRRGQVAIGEGTRLTIGKLPLSIDGQLARQGPSLRLALRADELTEDRVKRSLPPAILGPLLDVGVRGSWDYHVALDLDLSKPDSVRFDADVIPHELALDPRRTRLSLLELDQPFVAVILLPHGARAVRELSDVNPHFRTLDRISPDLAHAVVTNEDGGFFHHRGFNTEAMKKAIAENLKAGAYRRGAGTITMQLARNLYTGHTRTLSRKGQEIVLAWVLEHLTGVSKERLLEIYLNIIEWGPGIHGADEASRFYFDRDASQVSLDEALFLATVVPAPSRWRWRFAQDGTLKSYVKAQMHFIGRAMVAKGWLSAEALPPTDSLRIELSGPARAILFPADTLRADSLAS
jgi:Transglycosylase